MFYENCIGLTRGITSMFGCRKGGKPHKATVRTFGASAEIQTKDLSNTIQKRYRFNHIVESHDREIRKATRSQSRSQWPGRLTHELSSVAQTLGSWVRIPLEAWMSMCAFILCLCCSVYR
jgi:hypothetical protein